MPRLSTKIHQTNRRTLNMRYKEHNRAIRHNSNSRYSNHILNTWHIYGTITNITDIIKTGKKGTYLDTLEKYHIYRISKDNLQMNDTYNPIFRTLCELYARQQQHTPPVML
jgi:hypothetical protein